MKLYLNPPSPYARKVVVVAHEVGIADKIEIINVDPWLDPPNLLDATSLCKVPALINEDGALIVESGTIAEYLMDWAGLPLPLGRTRYEILARAAVSHGMMDAAFVSVIERRRPRDKQWEDWIARQYRALTRTLKTLTVPPSDQFDLGDVTLASTLAYLDFRLKDLPWRDMRADIAEWLDNVSKRPSMIASNP